MPLFLNRSGSNGEFEQRFLNENRIYFNWSELNTDMSQFSTLQDFYDLFAETYPDWTKGKQQNNARQASQFVRSMEKGDWAIMPSKLNPTIHFGKITGDYKYEASDEDRFQHSRAVDWFAQDIPRDRFDQDILYSLGAFLTICRIKRNNAEDRIKEMAENQWHVPANSRATLATDFADENADSPENDDTKVDLEENAYDQIARLILAKFKGHGLADLVSAILKVQGYVVHQPRAGPDHGVDLLASGGSLGFGDPRICVQVKSAENPVERVVLDQLIGTMQNFNAQFGLLISWGGFKQSLERERASQFFRVRLWNRDDFIKQLLANYHLLSEEIRSEIPLKQIWTVARTD